MAELPDVLYVPDGPGRFAPTELTRGPWSPDAQHGGAPAALLGGLIERFEPVGARVARLTVELLRPVPLTPLASHLQMLRPGKRVQLVQASLLSGDQEVVRATGLRVREQHLPISDPDPEAVPPMGEASEFWFSEDDVVMFGHAFEITRERDWSPGAEAPGPQLVWFRLRASVVAGETPTPLQRVAAAADFPNGISSIVPWAGDWLFINPDLTITLARPPDGEWVGLDARTVPSDDGVGFAEARVFDERGRIGRATQSLLFDRT